MMDEENSFQQVYSEPDQNALANMPDKEFDALNLTPQEQQEFETWYAANNYPGALPPEARASKTAAYRHYKATNKPEKTQNTGSMPEHSPSIIDQAAIDMDKSWKESLVRGGFGY